MLKTLSAMLCVLLVSGCQRPPVTPELVKAVNDRDYALARETIEQGADVNGAVHGGFSLVHVQSTGKTALHQAIRRQAPLEFIAYLLEHGADVTNQDHLGRTPLDYCVMYQAYEQDNVEFHDRLRLLVSHTHDPSALAAGGYVIIRQLALANDVCGLDIVMGLPFERQDLIRIGKLSVLEGQLQVLQVIALSVDRAAVDELRAFAAEHGSEAVNSVLSGVDPVPAYGSSEEINSSKTACTTVW